MALIECPDCTHQVSTLAVACPNCGRPFSPPGEPVEFSRTATAIGQAVSGLIVLALCLAFPPLFFVVVIVVVGSLALRLSR